MSELISVLLIGAILCFLIFDDVNTDYTPESIQWVQDQRNGCSWLESTPLANQRVHVGKAEYRPKFLNLYICNNNQIAALIEEEPNNVKP